MGSSRGRSSAAAALRAARAHSGRHCAPPNRMRVVRCRAPQPPPRQHTHLAYRCRRPPALSGSHGGQGRRRPRPRCCCTPAARRQTRRRTAAAHPAPAPCLQSHGPAWVRPPATAPSEAVPEVLGRCWALRDQGWAGGKPGRIGEGRGPGVNQRSERRLGVFAIAAPFMRALEKWRAPRARQARCCYISTHAATHPTAPGSPLLVQRQQAPTAAGDL